MDAEIENMAMYERLITATQEANVIRVLSNLQAAWRDKHLPAFQRFLERSESYGQKTIAEKTHRQEEAGMTNNINKIMTAAS